MVMNDAFSSCVMVETCTAISGGLMLSFMAYRFIVGLAAVEYLYGHLRRVDVVNHGIQVYCRFRLGLAAVQYLYGHLRRVDVVVHGIHVQRLRLHTHTHTHTHTSSVTDLFVGRCSFDSCEEEEVMEYNCNGA